MQTDQVYTFLVVLTLTQIDVIMFVSYFNHTIRHVLLLLGQDCLACTALHRTVCCIRLFIGGFITRYFLWLAVNVRKLGRHGISHGGFPFLSVAEDLRSFRFFLILHLLNFLLTAHVILFSHLAKTLL